MEKQEHHTHNLSIYDILRDLNIEYEKIEHPPVFTVEDLEVFTKGVNAGESKNLLLRNDKGSIHYLIVAETKTEVNLKQLASLLNEKKLSFASTERLEKYLGVTPGAVSPFGLINDATKSVRVIIDNKLLAHERLAYHPNVNTATLILATADLKKFLASTGNSIRYMQLVAGFEQN